LNIGGPPIQRRAAQPIEKAELTMNNIVAFPFKTAQAVARPQDVATQLLSGFGAHRRPLDDVFWLKENAEILGILAATDTDLSDAALEVYAPFYDQIEERLQFFPQYYRFLLSICLDLEDLGMPGDKGAKSGAAEAELSDLQRAEARRLLNRRGAAKSPAQGALGARLNAFMGRSHTFAMPNKKAAYELTHIVFYLSEYGRKPLALSPEALTSLEYAGVLAYLDQNTDLLAEICAALRFAGQTPSVIWEEAVATAHHDIIPVPEPVGQDAYHAYLVTGWAQKIAGHAAFTAPVPEGAVYFTAGAPQGSVLRPLSACLYDLGAERSADWGQMRGHVLSYLSPKGHEVLVHAEGSTKVFDAFFEGFARAAHPKG
jgi:hypothetical protein